MLTDIFMVIVIIACIPAAFKVGFTVVTMVFAMYDEFTKK